MVGNDIKNKSPSKNIQILKGIFIGLFGFPNALIDILILLQSLKKNESRKEPIKSPDIAMSKKIQP